RREKEMQRELSALKKATDDIEASVAGEGQSDLAAFAGDDAAGDEEATSDAAGDGDGPTDSDATADGDGATDDESGDDSRVGSEPSQNDADGSGVTGLTDFAAEASGADETAEPDGVVATAGVDDGIEVVVDQRELDSSIAKTLSTRDGLLTRLETLAVGDYVLSDRVAVERKSAADFVDSMLDADRSMFEQVGELSRAYARPVLVVEGADLYGQRDIDPNAIRGALASLAVDFGISVLRTDGETDTTELLATIARREQETRDREVSVHGEKTTKTRAEQQEYVVSAIADIGPVTARALLEHFGTVEAVMTAPEDDLREVDGVGPVTAERIREVVGSEYA
ncbi:MAG: ERCC4-type nuclease, partial [uncultured archaeon A07HR67]